MTRAITLSRATGGVILFRAARAPAIRPKQGKLGGCSNHGGTVMHPKSERSECRVLLLLALLHLLTVAACSDNKKPTTPSPSPTLASCGQPPQGGPTAIEI